MSRRISPLADPEVWIPFHTGYYVTVGALLDVEHKHLANSVGLSLEEFENQIRAMREASRLRLRT